MSNKQISSVEWLAIQLWEHMNMQGDGAVVNELLEQAKAMHKEEMEQFFKGGMSLVEGRLWKPIDKFEEYYNQTFNNNEQ